MCEDDRQVFCMLPHEAAVPCMLGPRLYLCVCGIYVCMHICMHKDSTGTVFLYSFALYIWMEGLLLNLGSLYSDWPACL